MKSLDLISIHLFPLRTTKPSYRASGCHNGGLAHSHTTRRISSKRNLRSNISEQRQVLVAVKALLFSPTQDSLDTAPPPAPCAPVTVARPLLPEDLRVLHLLFLLARTLSFGSAGILLSFGDQLFKRQHLRNTFYLKQAFWLFPIQPVVYSCQVTYNNPYFLISLFTVCL